MQYYGSCVLTWYKTSALLDRRLLLVKMLFRRRQTLVAILSLTVLSHEAYFSISTNMYGKKQNVAFFTGSKLLYSRDNKTKILTK